MKKKVILVLSLVVSFIALSCVLTACKEEMSELEKFQEKISYRQDSLFAASDDSFVVSLSGGVSEQDFIIDGKVGQVKAWTQLRVMPKNTLLAQKTYTYKLIGDKGEIAGQLVKEMLGVGFAASISDLNAIGTPSQVVIESEELKAELPLTDCMQGIKADKALEIAIGEFRTQIDASEDGVNREIYIKYINDRHNPQSPYCWYVSFIASNEDFWAVLISSDGKVISKRV